MSRRAPTVVLSVFVISGLFLSSPADLYFDVSIVNTKQYTNAMTFLELSKFTNCSILRDHKIIREDLWVRNGTIVDPEKVFFAEKVTANKVFDCKGAIISPGFIDLQINGMYYYFYLLLKPIPDVFLFLGWNLFPNFSKSSCLVLG